MPSNTFNTVSWVTMEGLDVLQAKLNVVKAMSSEYEDEFKKSYAVGDTITVPMPQRYTARENSLQFTPQGLARPTTTLTVDAVRGVDLSVTATELALHTERGQARFKEIYLDPAMVTLATSIERAAIAYMTPRINNVVGALGTTPTTVAPYAAAATRFEENDSFNDVKLFWTPTMSENIGTAVLTSFSSKYAGEAVREGRISGSLAGMTPTVSNVLSSHTAGTWAGAVTMTAGQSGSSIGVNCTTGDTFKAGDVITIAGVNNVEVQSRQSTGSLKQFTILADATGASSLATLSIYPAIVGPGNQQQNVDALPANTAALTLWPGTASPNGKSGKVGLALTKQAFMVASVPLLGKQETPGVRTESRRDPNSGFTITTMNWFDANTARHCWRFDVLFGFGTAYADNGAVKIASSK